MLLAQVVLGIGCAGMLMGPMTYAARAVAPASFGLWSGIILTFGNTGMLLSASPLAWLVDWQGWRAGFWAMAALAAIAFAAVALTVHQPPPARREPRSLLQDAREVLAIAASPRLRPLMVFAFASFAVVLGVRGLWGGPWLMEVKGYSRIEAGHVLSGCALALIVAPVACGWIDRWLQRPVLLLAGSHLIVAGLILALLAGRGLPLGFDALIFVLIGAVISFQMVTFGVIRGLVPPEQTGRALSAQNISFFGGAAIMQGVSGVAAAWGGHRRGAGQLRAGAAGLHPRLPGAAAKGLAPPAADARRSQRGLGVRPPALVSPEASIRMPLMRRLTAALLVTLLGARPGARPNSARRDRRPWG